MRRWLATPAADGEPVKLGLVLMGSCDENRESRIRVGRDGEEIRARLLRDGYHNET